MTRVFAASHIAGMAKALMPSIERSIRRVYDPPPVREDYPSRPAYRRAVRDWIKRHGPLPPTEKL